MPNCSPKSTLTTFSPIPLYLPGDPNLSFEDLFETGPHSPDTPSPPPMNPIFQPVQEPDIKTSNKEMPASTLPSLSSEVELQLQQISAKKPFSQTPKTAEDTPYIPPPFPICCPLALSPPSPPQQPVTQITQTTLLQIQQAFIQPFPTEVVSALSGHMGCLSWCPDSSGTSDFPTAPP